MNDAKIISLSAPWVSSIKPTNRSTNEEIIMEKISLIIGGIHLVYYFPRSPEQFTEPIINWEAFESFISLHIRRMWETTVMHKQVSGWTVNFCPNSPVYPFLKLKTRILPPPPFRKTSDLGWPKFYSGIPPPFWKTSDLRWPKFTPEYPPISENFRFGMTKVYSGIPPPPFWKTSDLGCPKFTPEYPPFRKTSDLGWPKFTPEYPPPQWKLSESPSPRFSEYRELLHVETLSNPDNY